MPKDPAAGVLIAWIWLPGLCALNAFIDTLLDRLLSRILERFVTLDPKLTIGRRSGLVIDLGEQEHCQLLKGILVI
jgi:hypothetical protein